MVSPKLPYQAFMGAIKHTHREEIKEILQEYNIGKYIISNEISKDSHLETNGEHLHFVVEMSNEDYHRFSKRVFIDKFQLRGRATKDKPRQYGKVSKIKNIEKMKAYSLKDGDYISNLDPKELDQLYQQSYKKTEDIDDLEKIYIYLGKLGLKEIDPYNTSIYFDNQIKYYENQQVPEHNYHRLCKGVIRYYIENNKTRKGLTKATVESIVRKYIMYVYEMDNELKTEWIYDSLFHKH